MTILDRIRLTGPLRLNSTGSGRLRPLPASDSWWARWDYTVFHWNEPQLVGSLSPFLGQVLR
jgi:hypothetical protein